MRQENPFHNVEDDQGEECEYGCQDEPTHCNLSRGILLKHSMKSAEQDDSIKDDNYTRELKEGQYFRIGDQLFWIANFSGAEWIGVDDTNNEKTNYHLTKQIARIYIVQRSNNSNTVSEREHHIFLLSVYQLGENIYASAIQNNVKEAGHIAAFNWEGEAYWVIGQKNAHIVVRYNFPEEDLVTFKDEYYCGVLEFALLCKDFFKRHTQKFEEGGLCLNKFHHTIAERGWTCYSERASCGNCDLQDQNAMEELHFYAIIQNDVFDGNENTEHTQNNSFCVDADHVKIFLKEVGFIFSEHNVQIPHREPERDVLLDDINHSTGPVECIKHDYSDQSNKPCLYNNNSKFYQMECVAQEAIMVQNLFGKSLEKHLSEKIRSYGRFPPISISNWKKKRLAWLLRFASWLHTTKRLDLSVKYTIPLDDHIWRSLQDEFKKSLSEKDELKSFREYCEDNVFNNRRVTENPDIIQIDGIPDGACDGKRALSRILFFLLKQACFNPELIAINEFKDDEKCLYHIENRFCSKKFTHLILDDIEIDKLPSAKSPELRPIVTILWRHKDDSSKFDSVSSERLKNFEKEECLPQSKSFSPSPDNTKEEISETSRVHFGLADERDELERGHVVLLDITMSPQKIIKAVWNALKKGGKHKLPELATLNLKYAVDVALEYRIVSDGFLSIPIYASIEIMNPQKTLLRHIPRKFLLNKVVQESFHLTTKFFGGVSDPLFLAELRVLEDKKIDLTLVWVLSDSCGTAVVVRNTNGREFPCDNLFPHITIANSSGTRPVYSNTLCLEASKKKCREHNPIKVVKLPPGTTVRGYFTFH